MQRAVTVLLKKCAPRIAALQAIGEVPGGSEGPHACAALVEIQRRRFVSTMGFPFRCKGSLSCTSKSRNTRCLAPWQRLTSQAQRAIACTLDAPQVSVATASFCPAYMRLLPRSPQPRRIACLVLRHGPTVQEVGVALQLSAARGKPVKTQTMFYIQWLRRDSAAPFRDLHRKNPACFARANSRAIEG